MDSQCVAFGACIALLVSLVKQVPFVAARPKTAAGLLATVSAAVPYLPTVAGLLGALLTGTRAGAYLTPAALAHIAQCAAIQFGAAVVTHEVALKPAARDLLGAASSYARGYDAGAAQAGRDAYAHGFATGQAIAAASSPASGASSTPAAA